ncbi:hypothetical protein AXK30_05170 [Escherichia coli]|nr:hypothetical protein AXK30_05170 [Escherichia coli]
MLRWFYIAFVACIIINIAVNKLDVVKAWRNMYKYPNKITLTIISTFENKLNPKAFIILQFDYFIAWIMI